MAAAATTDSMGSKIASMGDNYGLRLDPAGGLGFYVKTDRVPDTMTIEIVDRDLRDGQWPGL